MAYIYKTILRYCLKNVFITAVEIALNNIFSRESRLRR